MPWVWEGASPRPGAASDPLLVGALSSLISLTPDRNPKQRVPVVGIRTLRLYVEKPVAPRNV